MKAVIVMLSLQHPYIRVASGVVPDYGGNQLTSSSAMVGKCGCGIIAATDTLLYLSRHHFCRGIPLFRDMWEDAPIPAERYDACIRDMRRACFPLIPYARINGLMLMAGMQRFFLKYAMPYRAYWRLGQRELWPRIEGMLRADIPVIMSVGPNFPLLWGDKRACFYTRGPDGRFIPAAGAKAHYFTVTGMDESWLQISSWGRLYYLNRREYEDYVSAHSIGFVNNILEITGA